MSGQSNENDVMDEFQNIIGSMPDAGSSILGEWRRTHVGNAVAAVDLIPTGTHLIECELDFEEKRLSVVTELGDVIDLGFTDHGVGSAFENLIDIGEAEVLAAMVDMEGCIALSVTDGEDVFYGQFDCLAVTSFGFFDN